MLFKEWLDEWLERYVKVSTARRTYEKYRQQVEKYIIPPLGDLDAKELSAVRLSGFSAELASRGLSASTANGIISVLKTAIKKGSVLGVTNGMGCEAIERHKSRVARVSCFDKAEQKKIERFIFTEKKPSLFGILLCLYSGLRIGELLALTWSDVDFENGTLSITKSCHDSWVGQKYVKVFDFTKTPCSERVIPLPKQIMTCLKELKKQTGETFIVVGKSIYGAEIRSYQRTFTRLLQKLDIEHKGFHALRHTFATRALEVGMDVKTLSEILGHQNPSITLRRYAHSLFEHKTEMMNKVGKLLL